MCHTGPTVRRLEDSHQFRGNSVGFHGRLDDGRKVFVNYKSEPLWIAGEVCGAYSVSKALLAEIENDVDAILFVDQQGPFEDDVFLFEMKKYRNPDPDWEIAADDDRIQANSQAQVAVPIEEFDAMWEGHGDRLTERDRDRKRRTQKV